MARVPVPGQDDRPLAGTSISFFVREAFRRTWVSRRTSLLAVSMITVSLTIFGLFLLVSENLSRAVSRWQGKSHVTVYLDPDITAEATAVIDAHLASRPTLERRRFVSREDALEKFRTFFSDLSATIDDLDENPFPASYEIEVPREVIRSKTFNDDIASVRRLPGVEDIQFDWEWMAKVGRVVTLLNLAGLLAGGVLALAAVFTIANVTRLTMVLYEEEVDIMRLVGATERIIRGPFLAEGILQGTIGGAVALALLFAIFTGAQRLVGPTNAVLLQFLFLTFLPWTKAAAVVLCGSASGLIGSWLALRRVAAE